jgi:hypothetical protein
LQSNTDKTSQKQQELVLSCIYLFKNPSHEPNEPGKIEKRSNEERIDINKTYSPGLTGRVSAESPPFLVESDVEAGGVTVSVLVVSFALPSSFFSPLLLQATTKDEIIKTLRSVFKK